MVGRPRQRAHSAAHGFVGCTKNVNAVDFLGLYDCTGPEDFRAIRKFFKETLTFCVGEFLRVGENGVRKSRREDCSSSDDRACKGTTPCFIDACHKTQTSRTKSVFVREAANLWTAPH
ncbi:MAG: hypothetical protein RL088_3893 [Verrucomicrobiota bacterium]